MCLADLIFPKRGEGIKNNNKVFLVEKRWSEMVHRAKSEGLLIPGSILLLKVGLISPSAKREEHLSQHMFLLIGRRGHQNTLYESRSSHHCKDFGTLRHLFEAGIKV